MLIVFGLIAAVGIIFYLAPKRRAIWAAVAIYLISIFVSIFIFAMKEMQAMTETGQGDPQLLAGSISEMIVTEGLAAIIFIPILIVTYFIVKRRKTNNQGRS